MTGNNAHNIKNTNLPTLLVPESFSLLLAQKEIPSDMTCTLLFPRVPVPHPTSFIRSGSEELKRVNCLHRCPASSLPRFLPFCFFNVETLCLKWLEHWCLPYHRLSLFLFILFFLPELVETILARKFMPCLIRCSELCNTHCLTHPTSITYKC